jgi:hypothetical protein
MEAVGKPQVAIRVPEHFPERARAENAEGLALAS